MEAAQFDPGADSPSRATPARAHPDVPRLAEQAAIGSPGGLGAPWRLEYLESMSAAEKAAAGQTSTGQGTGCFLRDNWLDPAGDERNHVVVRARHGLILLNAFPYSSGHLLAALGEGRPTLMDYTPQQRACLWRLVDAAADLVTATLEPQGINIGINQGRAAGAGVPQHLHAHLVPRWHGDINFVTVVGQIRVLPSSLTAMAQRYRAAWTRLAPRWLPIIDSE